MRFSASISCHLRFLTALMPILHYFASGKRSRLGHIIARGRRLCLISPLLSNTSTRLMPCRSTPPASAAIFTSQFHYRHCLCREADTPLPLLIPKISALRLTIAAPLLRSETPQPSAIAAGPGQRSRRAMHVSPCFRWAYGA